MWIATTILGLCTIKLRVPMPNFITIYDLDASFDH